MTIKAWPDLRTGTGEVVKNFNIFWARWENILGATVLAKTEAVPLNFSINTPRLPLSRLSSLQEASNFKLDFFLYSIFWPNFIQRMPNRKRLLEIGTN